MEWIIRESSHGGVVAMYGEYHNGGCHINGRAGATMPAFITYKMSRFDTREEAEKYIEEEEE